MKDGRAHLLKQWEKAQARLIADQEGAVTSARTVLESTCKHILDSTNTSYPSDGDLPKLYSLVSGNLGLSAKSQTSDINKRLLGSVHTIIQAVGELRNKAGDAHGKSFNEPGVSSAQAELSVNLAGSIINFLLGAFDRHLAAVHRLTADGKAILVFDKATVWRLVDHARNAPKHLSSYGRRSKGALWLVGDAGVYLMSNGSPPQLYDGSIKAPEVAGETPRLIAYAQGCGTEDDVDNWWPIHNAIQGGDDFTITIPIKHFASALSTAEKYIVIMASDTDFMIYDDIESAEEINVAR